MRLNTSSPTSSSVSHEGARPIPSATTESLGTKSCNRKVDQLPDRTFKASTYRVEQVAWALEVVFDLSKLSIRSATNFEAALQ